MERMTHAESVQANGHYLLFLRAIHTAHEFRDEIWEWESADELGTYCLDRGPRSPAGSCVDKGLGAQQQDVYIESQE